MLMVVVLTCVPTAAVSGCTATSRAASLAFLVGRMLMYASRPGFCHWRWTGSQCDKLAKEREDGNQKQPVCKLRRLSCSGSGLGRPSIWGLWGYQSQGTPTVLQLPVS